jgi:hypothetical protein
MFSVGKKKKKKKQKQKQKKRHQRRLARKAHSTRLCGAPYIFNTSSKKNPVPWKNLQVLKKNLKALSMEADDTYNAFDDTPAYSDPVKPESLSTGSPYEESAYDTAVDTGANYSASAAKDDATDDTRKPGMRGTIDFYKSKVSFLLSSFFLFHTQEETPSSQDTHHQPSSSSSPSLFITPPNKNPFFLAPSPLPSQNLVIAIPSSPTFFIFPLWPHFLVHFLLSQLFAISFVGALAWFFFAFLFLIAGILLALAGGVIGVILFFTIALFWLGGIIAFACGILSTLCIVMFWICLIIGVIFLVLACIRAIAKPSGNSGDGSSTSTSTTTDTQVDPVPQDMGIVDYKGETVPEYESCAWSLSSFFLLCFLLFLSSLFLFL